MAKRAQSAFPQKPQSEGKPEERWWKTPAIIAAVIAALAAISVALINQRSAPKPNPSDPPHMSQENHPPGSPATPGVQGNVTVTKDVAITASGGGTAVMQTGQGTVHITNIHGISEEKYERLTEELGVTRTALESFFKILERQQVPREDLDSTLRDIVKHYKELQDKLHTFTSDEPAVRALKQKASNALDAGDFTQAEKVLNEASQHERIKQLLQEMDATTHRLTFPNAEIGGLQETQLRQPCSDLQAVPGTMGYQHRSAPNRCEGLYQSPVAGKSLEFLSFVMGRIDYDLMTDKVLIVAVPDVSRLEATVVHVRARVLPLGTYYRMDAIVATVKAIEWPLNTVIEPAAIHADSLGVIGWIGDEAQKIYVPVSVLPKGKPPTPRGPATALLRSLVDIEEVRWRLWARDTKDQLAPWQVLGGNARDTIRAGEPILITLPIDTTSQNLEIAAKKTNSNEWLKVLWPVFIP
jgi:hypothetical protein